MKKNIKQMWLKFIFTGLILLKFISCEISQDITDQSGALTLSQEENEKSSQDMKNVLPAAIKSSKYILSDLKIYFIDEQGKALKPDQKIYRKNIIEPSNCDFLKKIRYLLKKGDFEKARELLLLAIENNPENRKLLEILATVELVDENWESVIDLAAHALQSEPNDIGFMEKMAASQFMLSDLYGAMEGFDDIIQILNKYYPENRVNFCDPLTQCCQDSNEKFLKAKSGMATVYYNMGDLDEAERLAKEVIAVKKDSVEAKFVLSLVFGKRGLVDDSIENYKSILSIIPGNACVLNNIGVLYYRKKELDTALKYFETSFKNAGINKRTKAIACTNIGDIYVLQGNYPEAENKYLEAIKISPRYPGVYFSLGELYDLMGRDEEAARNVEYAQSLDPENINKFNSTFIEPEWEWQRDGLIAELEKNTAKAEELWEKILDGKIDVLKPVALKHLKNLARYAR